jgi:hypothetical protein
MEPRYGGGKETTYRRRTQVELLEARMIYAEQRRIIFAVLMISVYLVLLLSDFAMTTSLEKQRVSI